MNYALPLSHPAPFRVGIVLILTIAYLLASAVSLAPTLSRTAGAPSHSEVCHCAHCPGGALCCCRAAGKCPSP